MKNRLKRKFFTRSTLEVAKDLLGKYLVRRIGKRKLVGKIVETEAYIGPKDRASHSYKGKITERNKAEYLIHNVRTGMQEHMRGTIYLSL